MVIKVGRERDPAKRIRQRQGSTIRKIREDIRQLSVEEFAERLDVTPGAVRHWETGRYSPRPHHQVAIARTLDVPWSTIFGLDAESAA